MNLVSSRATTHTKAHFIILLLAFVADAFVLPTSSSTSSTSSCRSSFLKSGGLIQRQSSSYEDYSASTFSKDGKPSQREGQELKDTNFSSFLLMPFSFHPTIDPLQSVDYWEKLFTQGGSQSKKMAGMENGNIDSVEIISFDLDDTLWDGKIVIANANK